ncbi:hypothetical protein PRIPAC_88090 [Pristionchus pacificus]|uniref:Uncharacterized protein n=1 Tax=Pristionchus pacificus TaxID=54126 RepID=A0A2A6CIS9_PRIPA|nr:hypothetical protein PRIPAC_88090 [Pristionchus pacificus]|eukprot:PDM78125.1 hypothetical protein PRIPAC_30510 [Pristionchus pacificus]
MSQSGMPSPKVKSSRGKSLRADSFSNLPDAVAPTPPGFSPIWPRSKEDIDPDMKQTIIALATDATISAFLIIIAVVKFIFQSIVAIFNTVTDYLADAIRPFYLKCCIVHTFYKKHPEETKMMVRILFSFSVLSFLCGTLHSLNSTFFTQKLGNFSLSAKQIEEIANKFNSAAKPQQAITNIVKKLSKKNRSEIKEILLEMNNANKYIDKMFDDTMNEAKKVVNATVIDKMELLKSSHDDAFKTNFAVAQSSLLKAASSIVDNSTLSQLKNAINSPLVKIGNDSKGLEKLKSYITFFQ